MKWKTETSKASMKVSNALETNGLNNIVGESNNFTPWRKLFSSWEECAKASSSWGSLLF